MSEYRQILESFTEDTLPDLDTVMLGALELFSEVSVPSVDLHAFKNPLVVGSGNAGITGRVLFNDVHAVFADESSYVSKLDSFPQIDGAFLLSASGSKHAVQIAKELKQRGIQTMLLTNNVQSPAAEFVTQMSVFPKNREPYTYNTSTYMGMILSQTKESPHELLRFIGEEVAPVIPPDLGRSGAFYLILPEAFGVMREMFVTKFDELFGPKVVGRIFNYEQTKHAKTVIGRDDELFISFGVSNEFFGKEENRVAIPMPEGGSYGAMMAIGYYVIGQIQKQLPPYYKDRIAAYTKETSEAFGNTITPIVS
jgi:hypothetical protein